MVFFGILKGLGDRIEVFFRPLLRGKVSGLQPRLVSVDTMDRPLEVTEMNRVIREVLLEDTVGI